MAQDYYSLLGVARDADDRAIKSAFRKLAMQYHPDRNPGDAAAEKKFKEIGEAYEILSDEQKRAAYDRFGHAAFQNGGGAGAGAAGGFSTGAFSDIFEDIFGEFMGGGARRGGGSSGRGGDIKHDIAISLEDSFKGFQTSINVPSSEACETCSGSGAAPGTGPSSCGSCGGIGRVRMQQGIFSVERTCPTCNGQGQIISDPCTSCSGQGRIHKKRKLSIEIPAGVEDGTRIRLAGEGEAGMRGGPFGDLYLFVSVKRHALFERDGADLYCTMHVPMTTASLGGEIEAPTIDGGRVKVKIPEGSQTGRRFRLRDKGMSILRRKGRGDLYLELVVETPVKLSSRQKELLREFNTECGEQSNPESQNFFQKARAFWDNMTDGG